MSEPRSAPGYAVIVERDVPVTMRDGTVLMADVYRPDSPGEFPALIERTPYSKADSSETKYGAGEFYASRGYVTIFQDVRGRFASEGKFYPFRDDGGGERRDGFDTVEWVAEQPWCDGKVGTIGGSYSGATQYQMHAAPSPHLKAQFARQSSADYWNEWVYRNGVLELGFNLSWTTRHTATHARIWSKPEDGDRYDAALKEAVKNLPEEMRKLPILRDDAVSELATWWHDWLRHPESGPYWDEFNITQRFADASVPIHHLGGWYDGFLRGSLDNFTGVRKVAKSELARANQRLTVGPWVHAPDAGDLTSAGEVDFGEAAAIGFFETRLKWFDHWLKGIQNGVPVEAPVRLFTMGANRWSEFDNWPPPNAKATPFYLDGDKANVCRSLNDGSLSQRKPESGEPDSYDYDPMDPVWTLGGSHLGAAAEGVPNGPRDQRPNHSRVLTYTGQPLDRELNVTGEVRAVLHASSSAPDTDWVIKLVDVHPGGKAMLVCDGVMRARYRKSGKRAELLDGGIERYEIDMWGTSHVFKRGHRMQVIVTSSDFPRWDRNMNTGGANAQETAGKVARNTVYHDAERPSHVLLPVIEG